MAEAHKDNEGTPGIKSTNPNNLLHFVKTTVLTTLFRHKASTLFKDPVNPLKDGVPNYFTYIDKPMDMKQIRERINKGEYADMNSCLKDFSQMMANSYLYNEPSKNVVSLTKDVELTFLRRLSEFSNKSEENGDGEHIENANGNGGLDGGSPSIHDEHGEESSRRCLRVRQTMINQVEVQGENVDKPSSEEDDSVDVRANGETDDANMQVKEFLLRTRQMRLKEIAQDNKRMTRIQQQMKLLHEDLEDITRVKTAHEKGLQEVEEMLASLHPSGKVPSSAPSKQKPKSSSKVLKRPPAKRKVSMSSTKTSSPKRKLVQSEKVQVPKSTPFSDTDAQSPIPTPLTSKGNSKSTAKAGVKRKKPALPSKPRKLVFNAEAPKPALDTSKPLPEAQLEEFRRAMEAVDSNNPIVEEIIVAIMAEGIDDEDFDPESVDLRILPVQTQWSLYNQIKDYIPVSKTSDSKADNTSAEKDRPSDEPTDDEPEPSFTEPVEHISEPANDHQPEPLMNGKVAADVQTEDSDDEDTTYDLY